MLALATLLGCTGDDQHAGDQDGSTNMPPRSEDAGTGGQPSGSGGSSSPVANPIDASLPMFPPLSGKFCAIHVGAQCDGPEDCGSAESCCGIYDPTRLMYTSIACSESCAGSNTYPLCHEGDACAGDLVCRRSRILPHEFVAVCAPPAEVPAGQGVPAVAGRIACGPTDCEVGREHCCLAVEFVLESMSAVAVEPYCAPLDVLCSLCQGPPDVDAGVEADAG